MFLQTELRSDVRRFIVSSSVTKDFPGYDNTWSLRSAVCLSVCVSYLSDVCSYWLLASIRTRANRRVSCRLQQLAYSEVFVTPTERTKTTKEVILNDLDIWVPVVYPGHR